MAGADPIRVGILGLGRAGWGMVSQEITGHPEQFRIVAVADVLEDRRRRSAEASGCATYDGIRGLARDPQVELVVVATRSSDHYAHAMAALKAGKIVFVEKPMCRTHAEARRLAAAAARLQVPLFVRHNRRFEAGFRHIRDLIASGILGDVFAIKLRRNSYGRRDDWQTLKEFGGGQLLNWGPHIVDHALQFLDSPPVSVWSDLKRVAAVGDAEDHLKIVLRDAKGRVVDMEISGGAAIGEPAYIVLGTRGALTSSGGDEIRLRYLDPNHPLPPRPVDPGTPNGGFGSKDDLKWIDETIKVKPLEEGDIWDHLYRAIREGVPFPITTEQAVAVMKVISQTKRRTPFGE